jgi:hypothetical protein
LVAEVGDSDDGSVGFLIEAVSTRTIRALAGFGIHDLRSRVVGGGVAVVLVAEPLQLAGAPALTDVPVVEMACPAPSAVLRRRLEHEGRTGDFDDLESVLALLPEAAEPRRVVEVVQTVDCTPPFDPEEAAASFSSTSSNDALDTWLGEGRPAEDVAMLASAATLCEVPVGDVYVHAQQLATMIEPDGEDDRSGGRKVIRRVSQQWPQEMITLTATQVSTHFGMQVQQSIGFCKGHRPEWTLEFLWDRLGPEFRNPFVQWLVGLGRVL